MIIKVADTVYDLSPKQALIVQSLLQPGSEVVLHEHTHFQAVYNGDDCLTYFARVTLYALQKRKILIAQGKSFGLNPLLRVVAS